MVYVTKVSVILKKINKAQNVRENELMSFHTWFQTGGPADFFITPDSVQKLQETLEFCRNENIDVTLVGEGANLLVADSGIRGVTICLGKLQSFSIKNNKLIAGAGNSVDELVTRTSEKGFSGLEFLAGMPGSLGGALFMNARCYGSQVSDILESYDYIDCNGNMNTMKMDENKWGYKRSPLQEEKQIAVSAVLNLSICRNTEQSLSNIQSCRDDREKKGHYRAPCAGSFFKNNRDYGSPSGKIIEEAGLKGLRYGGAAVSGWHANILINEKNANSREIRFLSELIRKKVYRKTGFLLEPEVQFLGDWNWTSLSIPGKGERNEQQKS